MGLYRAGFDVTGIDIKHQKHYPAFHDAEYARHFKFIQADAMTFPLEGYDCYWASPPCQHFSYGTPNKSRHPNLIPGVRQRLIATERPWIIENVPGAPIRADFTLTGDMVGLCLIKRERRFETNWFDSISMLCRYERIGPVITITGHGTTSGNRVTWGRNIRTAEMRVAMGIGWMNRDELSQAIPPAYSEYLGKHMMAAVAALAGKRE